ncbi:MAG: response regulator [Sedimentisphaerales bacterium]|nr:response regulator [Sedimentisphaerales bacterium]
MKILHKLILGSLLLAGLIWSVGFYAVYVSRTALQQSIEENSAIEVSDIMRSVDRAIAGALHDWRVYATSPYLQQTLMDSNLQFEQMPSIQTYIDQEDQAWIAAAKNEITPFMTGLIHNESSEALRRHLDAMDINAGYKAYGEVFITNRYGANVVQTAKTSDYRQDDELWWHIAKNEGFCVLDVEYDDSADIYAVCLCLKIEDDQGNFLGVLKAVYNIEAICSLIKLRDREQYSQENNYYNLVLLTLDEKVIFSSNHPGKCLQEGSHYLNFTLEMDNHVKTRRVDDTYGEIMGICSYSRGYGEFEGLGWMLVAEQSVGEVFAPVDTLRHNILIMSIAITVLGLLLGFGFSITLSRRMTRLRRSALEIGAGNLDVMIEDHSSDEIGQFSTTFRNMAESLRDISSVCEAVAQGDFNQSVKLRSDKDVLGKSINQMGSTLRAVARQANLIAGGDYTTEIQPRSDKDELGMALLNMTTTLRETTAESEKQKWIMKGQAEIDNAIRGEQNLRALTSNIVNKLAEYLNVQIGAVYLSEDGNLLRLTATYAYKKRKGLSNQFWFGEGLIGQAAAEGKTIVITRIPDDYITVNSGLGEAAPKNIVVVPLLFEEEVKGVIELGSFDEFTDTQIELLEQVAEGIAIAVTSAESRKRVSELLEETQRQSEELQAQQEELRAANEELEQQTSSLQQSEERLKRQQEELETTNTELEAKTQSLEKQKQELEKARSEIEGKAKELELISKYKSEFLSNMSHELRTPLNSLLILAKMLMENKYGNLTEEQVESAGVIYEGGMDLLKLINEILDLSKIESGKISIHVEEVDIAEIAYTIEKNFGYMARDKGLDLIINVADDLRQSIRTDKMRLEQILKNLISNAIKFTEKGRVSVTMKRPEDEINLSAGDVHSKGMLIFEIADTGIGISPKKQKMVFEAFQQADGGISRKYGGTGLGLSISRELARVLGGEIMLESTEGQGSIFTLYLPFTTEPRLKAGLSTDEPDNDEESTEISESTESLSPTAEVLFLTDDRDTIGPEDRTILVIDDDKSFARIIYEMTHEHGFKCLLAGEGKSGLACALEYRPDAIILDVGLPDMDGLAVMDMLKASPQTRHIPVHFISACESDQDAYYKGAIGYMTKPVSKDHLNDAFYKIQDFISNSIRQLLLVEDNPQQRESIVRLISDDNIKVTSVGTGREAYQQLQSGNYDCMVLDLGLPDISGFELLSQIKEDESIAKPPIIVYSGRDLTREEDIKLQEYAHSIIIKGAASPERLLDETALFLHRVETDLPEDQQRMIRVLHDKDSLLNGKKLLLVDDDIRNIFALSHALKDKGLKVHIAENGKKALEFLDREVDVDAVLMDIMMPVMDGLEAIRRIRQQERFAHLPILALTAKAMAGDKEKCIEAGANDYIAKPVVIDKVISMLRVWLYK